MAATVSSMLGRVWVLTRSRGAVVAESDCVRSPTKGHDIVVVLGAGLHPDGSPTGLLARRVECGVRLCEAVGAESLIMSGANNDRGDEPGAMAGLAIELGMDPRQMVCDRTGVDTAATCRYLKLSYPGARGVLVTQEFHAARTAYLAKKAGLDVVVVATPDAEVRTKAIVKARARELPASLKAIFLDRM